MDQFDHLILLVGTNPLPNAVIGKLLAGSRTSVSLVYSDGTSAMAGNLKEWLGKQNPSPQQVLRRPKVNETEPVSIFDGVSKRLDEVDGKRVLLAYTGGTKVMAIHAYRAVEQWVEENDTEGQFVYLDAHSLCLQFERLRLEEGYPMRREYVGRAVDLSLEDMLALHGWRLNTKHKPRRMPILPDTAHELAQIFSKHSLNDNPWKAWWKNQKTNWLQHKQVDFPVEDTLLGVSNTLYRELKLKKGTQSFSWDQLESLGFSSPEEARKWIDGTWLEHHTLDVLNQLERELSIQERAQSVKTDGIEFEEDVVAIRGYQLYVFTITTSRKRADIKKRLFGAHIHACQLGGDEARVALICVADDPDGLRDEIQRDFDQEKRVKVFGRKHLAELKARISQWIREQSKEESTRCSKSYL